MIRPFLVLMISPLVFLAACSGENGEPQATAKPSEETANAESWREDQMLAGKGTYEVACASCHATGEGEAPAIGDKDAWSDRSGLWVAVLSDHANAGYLDMPEKGGHGELTDEAVSAAVEYMLLKTFPELPRD
jgi:cytochrome c oxidase cbb3-type subunit 3